MKIKLIIIGGFLGAGKTTFLKAAAHILQKQGKKVGLITNDQAEGLVDTHILSSNGLEVREIAGSCFCCNFDGLMNAALFLGDAGCDTILAEPVGSCTDLSATLIQPIKSYHSEKFELAPLSVLIDPIRLQKTFSDKKNTEEGSGYIYLKQLEEADYLIINKVDLLNSEEEAALERLLKKWFPKFSTRWISAIKETGVQSLLEMLYADTKTGTRVAEVDYGIYAEGETRMGWLNADFIISHANAQLIPWMEFNIKFLKLLQAVFQHEGVAVGHIKTFLKSGPSQLQANLTGTNDEISYTGSQFSSTSARMIINIRAEAEPKLINEIVADINSVLNEEGICFKTVTLKYLKPGKPMPTHRLSNKVGQNVKSF